MIRRKQKNKKIKLVWIGLVVIGAAALIFFVFNAVRSQTSNQEPREDGRSGINYEPTTNEEKAETDARKEEIAEQISREQQGGSGGGQITVTPVIASWGQNPQTKAVEVGAFVPGIYENGGTCTLTLTKNSTNLTTSTTGTKNVSDTSCGIMSIARGQLSAGQWKAKVSYDSPNASGSSAEINIDVE